MQYHYLRKQNEVLMKTGCLCLWLFLIPAGLVNAQPTNISGIVNTYHKVVEVIPAKACLRVNSTTGLNLGNMVMLIQMKGASILTANNASFGDTTSLNGAGNYEVGTICYIIGDSVFLYHNLVNTYDAAASVQLVRFAEYYAANVIDTVKAARWDSAAGTGGVIAIYTEDELIMNAPIFADTLGFRGGVFYSNTATCGLFQPAGTDFAYPITSTTNLNGAYKGESVANLATPINSAKGAPANGGGGGNNHNNSGGGGANLTAGGNGGGNSSGTPIGCATTGNYGRAGKALSSWGGKKIFMGGGAGAGHANNGGPTFNYGGNGGGIIFIWTNNLTGNNYKITANGGKGGDSQADGAGGGGAGGTIIMNVANYTGGVTVSTMGGNGGDSYNDNSIVRCFGGGGGGSGGAVYFSTNIPPVTVFINSGAGGQEFNRNAGCNAPVAGANGNTGQVFSNYTFTKSTHPAAYCTFLLPVKLLYFEAKKINTSVALTWETDQPEMARYFIIEKRTVTGYWSELHRVNSNPGKHKYVFEDQHPFSGNNFYRIKTEETSGTAYYSATRKVWFGPDKNSFVIYPNPASGPVILKAAFETGQLLQVRDMTGRIILQQNISGNSTWLQLPILPAGIYSIRYKDETKKLMIRH